MKIAYFDCVSGASGDMILGALFDAGLAPADLSEALSGLPIEPFRIETERRMRSGIAGTGVRIVVEGKAARRGFPEIAQAIENASLPAPVTKRAIAIFRILGEAEAAVHRIPIEKVHFHEVGAVDAIVDIVGGVTGLHMLGIEKVYASIPPTGTGTVHADHGPLPVPAPATVEILRGRPTRPTTVEGELLTPTGAALLVGLTDRFAPPPPFAATAIGYGVGDADRPELPNLLRISVGDQAESIATDTVLVLETDVDDAPPEALGYLVERVLGAGALDVQILPTVMKKNRPGHRVSVLVRPGDRDRLAPILLEESGTLGVRIVEADRMILPREVVERRTRYGTIRFKRALLPGGGARLTPEYEDCAALARERGIAYLQVWRNALVDGEEKE